MTILAATKNDLETILKLQYLAYQSEAELFGTKDIPPLKQTLDEVIEEFNKGTILKMIDDNDEIIRLYSKLGYKIFDEKKIDDELTFVYMEK